MRKKKETEGASAENVQNPDINEAENVQNPDINEAENVQNPDNQEAEVNEAETPKTERPTITSQIDSLLKCHPQYKRMYISKGGFVYPEGASKHLIKDAILYENKHYKPKKQ